MVIDKIAIWVHPLWSRNDLGKEIVSFWENNIARFSQDENYGFVLVGCPTDYCPNDEWAKRILPIIDFLPELFKERYKKWPSNFIDSSDKLQVKILANQFKIKEPEFYNDKYPSRYIFNEARVDGLIPGPNFCVGEQMRRIRLLVNRSDNVKYWIH